MAEILTLNNLYKKVNSLKAKGKIVCHCHGCFDLVHYGHLNYFEASKSFGDILIVTITPDKFIKKGPGRPVFDEKKRLKFLSELKTIDYVALNNKADAVELLKMLKPNFTFRGKEYEDYKKDLTGKIILEKNAIESTGGELKIIDEETFSSTNLINKGNIDFLSPEQSDFVSLIRRKKIPEKTLTFLDSIQNKKILNIGEIIIDEYVYTSVRGTVTKHPIISASFIDEIKMAGGVLATSRHLNSMIKNPELITTYGNENIEYLKFIKKSLVSSIKPFIFKNNGDYTVVKRRFISSSGYPNPLSDSLNETSDRNSENRLFEIGYIPRGLIENKTEEKLLNFLKKKIKTYDLVIVSDFGHGLMTKKIIKEVQKSRKLAINTQTNSTNFGFNLLGKYSKSNFLCIDELEARLYMIDKSSPINVLGKKIMKKFNKSELMITRGKFGLVYFKDNKIFKAPGLATKVVDPIGAGDALYTGAALASSFQKDPLVTVLLSSIMGMLGTFIEGNERGISRNEIIRSIKGLM